MGDSRSVAVVNLSFQEQGAGDGNHRPDLVGNRTERHYASVTFFSDVLGLGVLAAEAGITVLGVTDGFTVEVVGPASPWNRHLAQRGPDGFLYELVQTD